MAAVVSTRILRLQAVNPRTVTTLATFPVNPYEGQVYWDFVLHQMFVWNGSAWVSVTSGTTTQYIIRTLSLAALVPGVSVATGNVLVGPYTATPPSLSLDALVPGVSVIATSP